MLLVAPSTMAEMDRRTIEDLGVPGLVLMESAAGAVVRALLARFPDAARQGVGVVAGPGNNGGDGVAIARRLHGLGIPTRVLLCADPARLRGDAAPQLAQARAQDVPVTVVTDSAQLTLDGPGVWVDALLGTGLGRDVDGLFAAAIDALNADGAPVVAVDIPSGIDGATGQVRGRAVQADVTVTFAAAKIGQFSEPGRSHRGHLVVADIGIPASRFGDLVAGSPRLVSDVASSLRPRAGHKGTFGHLLVVAGSTGKAGAARLTAEAALRAGAGLVTLAVPSDLPSDSLAELAPEVMVERVPAADGHFGAQSLAPVLELLESRDALALGPGLGTADATVAFARALYEAASVPAVVDADALNALARGGIPRAASARVLTPHPGEMGRLQSTTARALNQDRLGSARALAGSSGAVVVLKGAGTVVAAPDGSSSINASGNPGMGTAGSGDVLTGVIGALLAGGAVPAAAARRGVAWHGRAGDHAAALTGEASLLASDITAALGAALQSSPEADWSFDPAGWRGP